MPEKQAQSHRWVYSVIAVACVVGAFAYFLFGNAIRSYITNLQYKQADGTIQNGKSLLYTGDSSTAAPVLEKSVQMSTNKTQEALARLNLGAAYIGSGLNEKGIEYLKALSIDPSYPAEYRSTAAQEVVEYYLSGKDVDFALHTIFSGPVWGGFMKGQGQDLNGLRFGVINALSWITTLGPSFAAYYELGSKYADELASSTNAKDIARYAVLVRQNIISGDAAYGTALQANASSLQLDPTRIPPFTNNRLGIGLEHKALALTELFESKASSTTLAEVVGTYEQAVSILEKDTTELSSAISALYTRYHFAVLLAHADKVANAEKIQTVLTPLYVPTLKNTNFYQGFLKQYGSNASYRGTPEWDNLIILSAIDSRFKALLLSLGWSATDLK